MPSSGPSKIYRRSNVSEERYVKLNEPGCCFAAPDLSLSGDEVGLLPVPPSQIIKDWLNAGGLIFCDSKGKPITKEEVSLIDEALPVGEVEVESETEDQEESVVKESVAEEPVIEAKKPAPKTRGRRKGSK
jgi:hypothetical protein